MNGNLSEAKETDFVGKKVIVRVDLDVPNGDNPRIKTAREIVSWLLERKTAKIKAIGHRGEYPVIKDLVQQFPEAEWNDGLRDDPREKENNDDFARELASDFDIYINEAFAVSHRKHTSVDALPRWMKKEGRGVYLGLRFEKEIEMLNEVWSRSGWKILVIGGAKAADKVDYAVKLSGRLDRVLVGGLLPLQMTADKSYIPNNIVLGKLREDQKDMADESIADFVEQVKAAQIVICAGPMGKFEEPEAEKGTAEVFRAVADSLAYKVAGGGNTEDAIAKYGLAEKFDWISVGGGAMLEFLASGNLPGLEAIIS